MAPNKKETFKINAATAFFTLTNVIVVDDLALPLDTLHDEMSGNCSKET